MGGGGYIIILIQVGKFSLYSQSEYILKDLLNELGGKVIIVAEKSTMKSFNGADIYQTGLYDKIIVGGL